MLYICLPDGPGVALGTPQKVILKIKGFLNDLVV